MNNQWGKIAVIIVFLMPALAFSQEMANEEYQKIIVMEGENDGWLEVYVDPLNFECECDELIVVQLIPDSDKKNIYRTEDNSVTFKIIEDYCVITVDSEECCFIRPGKYEAVISEEIDFDELFEIEEIEESESDQK